LVSDQGDVDDASKRECEMNKKECAAKYLQGKLGEIQYFFHADVIYIYDRDWQKKQYSVRIGELKPVLETYMGMEIKWFTTEVAFRRYEEGLHEKMRHVSI
jgi:hypothetical protein